MCKVFNIAKNIKHASHKGTGINSENQKLAHELHKLKSLKNTKYVDLVKTILGVQA